MSLGLPVNISALLQATVNVGHGQKRELLRFDSFWRRQQRQGYSSLANTAADQHYIGDKPTRKELLDVSTRIR